MAVHSNCLASSASEARVKRITPLGGVEHSVAAGFSAARIHEQRRSDAATPPTILAKFGRGASSSITMLCLARRAKSEGRLRVIVARGAKLNGLRPNRRESTLTFPCGRNDRFFFR